MSNELSVNKKLEVRTRLVIRHWRSEPLGIYDRAVEIWYNNTWVPAYFSDILAGDFFLDLKMNLEPDRCFLAASNVVALNTSSDNPTLLLKNGSQIVQVPAKVEIDITAIQNEKPLSITKD